MKKISLILLLVFFSGCTTTQTLTSLQRRAIEAKELEGNFDDAFKATLQVLQDYGYVITNSDYKAGVIQGETGEKYDFWWGEKNYKVTVTIEQFGENRVKERITFLETKGMSGWTAKHTIIVENAQLLQKIYDDIQKEIFIRQNLNK
jgi:hypothetical protein